MKDLKIEATRYTLGIEFNGKSGLLEIKGDSYPENPSKFFQGVFDWIYQFLAANPEQIRLVTKFNYLNTSSTKCILHILEVFDKFYAQGGKVEVLWYCDEEDDDIWELGEEFVEYFALPLDIISYQQKM